MNLNKVQVFIPIQMKTDLALIISVKKGVNQILHSKMDAYAFEQIKIKFNKFLCKYQYIKNAKYFFYYFIKIT